MLRNAKFFRDLTSAQRAEVAEAMMLQAAGAVRRAGAGATVRPGRWMVEFIQDLPRFRGPILVGFCIFVYTTPKSTTCGVMGVAPMTSLPRTGAVAPRSEAVEPEETIFKQGDPGGSRRWDEWAGHRDGGGNH